MDPRSESRVDVVKKTEEKAEIKKGSFSAADLTKKLLKTFGEDQVVHGPLSVKGMPFGVISLDKQIGTVGGGFPIGRMTEIYGDFATGKSLLGLMAIASTQAQGGIGVLIDAERAYNPDRAAELGVNTGPDGLIPLLPESQEECYKMIIDIVEFAKADPEKKPVTIVWDSVSALASEYEIEKEMGSANMASNARVNSGCIKQIVGPLAANNVSLIFINQIRKKIGVMFGKDWATSGGEAIGYYAGLRLHAKISKKIFEAGNEKGDPIGVSGVVEIAKNRFGPPFRKVSLELFYDGGIPRLSGLFDYLVNSKQLKPGLTKDGSPRAGYYSLEGVDETFTENTFYNIIENYPDVIKRIEGN